MASFLADELSELDDTTIIYISSDEDESEMESDEIWIISSDEEEEEMEQYSDDSDIDWYMTEWVDSFDTVPSVPSVPAVPKAAVSAVPKAAVPKAAVSAVPPAAVPKAAVSSTYSPTSPRYPYTPTPSPIPSPPPPRKAESSGIQQENAVKIQNYGGNQKSATQGGNGTSKAAQEESQKAAQEPEDQTSASTYQVTEEDIKNANTLSIYLRGKFIHQQKLNNKILKLINEMTDGVMSLEKKYLEQKK